MFFDDETNNTPTGDENTGGDEGATEGASEGASEEGSTEGDAM